MKACVIIPTYNEKDNITKLIDSLLDVFKFIKNFEMHILVVDDNSPDGTGQFVETYTKLHYNVHLITGEKKGLGAAYIRGFKYGMNKFDVLLTMDADLSHNPKKIPELLKQIEQGYDLVIGSRYVKGGSTPDWNLQRKIISKGGNLFAKIVGGLHNVNDCTSGFRAIKTDLLKKIDFRYLATKGYAFLTTSLYELYMADARIKEIPITFCDRKFGETKLTKKDMVEFFLNSCRLRLKTGERFTKFVIVGFSGVIVNTLLLFLFFDKFGLNLLLAGAIAIEFSIIYNFIFNDVYTFKDNKNELSFLARMFRFNLPALWSSLINLSILYLFVRYTNMYYLFANLIGISVAMAWNYIANIDWTWRIETKVEVPKKSTFSTLKANAPH